MSNETIADLNSNTLIGDTAHRGNAWHCRASEQGTESNHYAGAVPIANVERRLFSWQAESRPIAVETPADIQTMTHLSADGLPVRWVMVDAARRSAVPIATTARS
jgi:hypothetical protein